MPDDGHIVLDVWIAIEKLVSPVPDKGSAEQKDDYGDGECDAQRRKASLFNYRYDEGNIHFHENRLPALPIIYCVTLAGFSDAPGGGMATPSSGLSAESENSAVLASSLVVFCGEDGFRIRTGNFAHGNPADAADQRAKQK